MSKEYNLNRIEGNFKKLVLDSYRAIFDIKGYSFSNELDELNVIFTKLKKINFESPLKNKVETRTRRQEEAPNQIPIERNEQKATVEPLPKVQIEEISEPKRNDILSKDGKTARPGDYIYNIEDKEYIEWDPLSPFNDQDENGNPIPPFNFRIESPESNK